MIYTIQNDKLRLAVKNTGAEMTSLYNIKQQLEYLWQGNPSIWNGQAYNLFPVVCALANDQFAHNGKTYTLQKHGFARKMEFELVEQTAESLTLLLSETPQTLAQYPFEFRLLITYRLEENKIFHSFRVENTNKETMYFSVGGHPAFNLAVFEGETIEDYYLEFEKNETLSRLVDKTGFLKDHDLYLANEKIIPIKADTFKDDALVFGDLKSENIFIKNKKGNYQVKVNIGEFPYLGLWAKENAPYVCIEPWQGIPDAPEGYAAMSMKKGIVSLAAGEAWEKKFVIEIF
ncbi:MAG: aldose 1-epimerase family protein [Cytophagales bacterium]|nr:MAG: aldose 1-epimerase family protein [Cytophagales bacterium]